MTLRDTIRSILERLLERMKKARDDIGATRDMYQRKLDEERTLLKIRREAKQRR